VEREQAAENGPDGTTDASSDLRPNGERIFICHSKRNLRRARRLADALRAAGADVWFDEWEILVGQTITDRVYSGIFGSRYLLILLSPHAVQSRWVREELDMALVREIEDREITILPVLIEECQVPPALRKKRYVRLRHFQKAVSEILTAVGLEGAQEPASRRRKRDEMSRTIFAAEGLGRSLAAFLNNIRYHTKYSEVVEADGSPTRIPFSASQFWRDYQMAMEALGTTERALRQFAKARGIKDGDLIDGRTFADLLFAPPALAHRDMALHSASLLDVNPLVQRRLLALFDAYIQDPAQEDIVDEYLSLRTELGQEIGRKHGGPEGALVLFHMDLGVVLFVKGDFNCASVAADPGAVEVIKVRLRLAIDSARYLAVLRDHFADYYGIAQTWRRLFRDKSRLLIDIETLYSDITDKLHLAEGSQTPNKGIERDS